MRTRLLIAAVLVMLSCIPCLAEKNWEGVDKAVVEKFAKKHGIEPKDPLIDTDKGDLLLFVFTLAGVAGGFVIGYNFRKIFGEKKR